MDKKLQEFMKKMNEMESEYGVNICNKIQKVEEWEKEEFNKWFSKHSKNKNNDFIEFRNIVNGIKINGLCVYSLNGECEYNIYKKIRNGGIIMRN
ncbi:hypothetical protein FACS1894151_11150 [Spirochaetia bacterium]|nr:hypothetical protein FACS1894151_11150 [Spirochaetia bacterium]